MISGCKTAIMRYAAGTPLSLEEAKKLPIRVNKFGLPLYLPTEYLKGIGDGNITYIQEVMTILSINLLNEEPITPKMENVTKVNKANFSLREAARLLELAESLHRNSANGTLHLTKREVKFLVNQRIFPFR
jgi:hypothetical protein